MGVTLDDLPSFLVASVGFVVVVAGAARAIGVRRNAVGALALLVATVLGPTVLGVGPPALRSSVSYWLHAAMRTSAFTPEDKRAFDYDEVRSSLLLGRQPRNNKDLERLKAEGVIGFVTLNEPWELFMGLGGLQAAVKNLGMEHLHIETADFQGPKQQQTVKAVEFIARHMSDGGKVYVHCNAGRGRSATVAAAYLLAADCAARSPEEAWDPAAEVERVVGEMRVKRPKVTASLLRFPLTSQARALRLFATEDAVRAGDAWRKRR